MARNCGIALLVLFKASIALAQNTHAQSSDVQSSKDMRHQWLCPQWEVIGNLNPGFSDSEIRLICGDSEVQSWKKIPIAQAKYYLKNFLQDRGYHHPVFKKKVISERSDRTGRSAKMIVYLGEQSKVRRIYIKNSFELTELDLDISKKREGVGEPLTPAFLNSLENWIKDQLGHRGYACPHIESEADPDSGEVAVTILPGKPQKIFSITQEGIPNTAPSILRRYDAFSIGDLFNSKLLTVTENRVASSAIVESNHFTANCQDDGVVLSQTLLPGAPHLLIAGLGVNTEGFLLGKVTWKNTRLGNYASDFDISAFGSSKLQSVANQWRVFFLPQVSRIHFNPLLRIAHRNEQYYEDLTVRGQLGLASAFDYSFTGGNMFLGPTLDVFRILRGVGPSNTKLLSMEARAELKDHDFEYYITNPRKGYNLLFVSDFSHQSLYSSLTAQRLNLRGEMLWPLINVDPPLWILGLRGGFATIATGETIQGGNIPASLLRYLGGSNDIRGFGRQELPLNSDIGGLTSIFLGLELRLSQTLLAHLDPFIFGDIGAIGQRSFSFDAPVYWSPGLGLRWASPIGPLRTTIARGFSNSVSQHWQFYFSLGEEF